MPNAAYRNAANQERRVKARLEAEGWTVWRTPGSKSPADLVCVRGRKTSAEKYQMDLATMSPIEGTRRNVCKPDVLLVQCKNGTRPMSGPKRREFVQFAAGLGASAVLVEHGMKFTTLEGEV